MASANYKAFMGKIVASVSDTIKEQKVEDLLQVQSLQMMANGICMCIQQILKEDTTHEFENSLIFEWKSPDRLLKHCIDEAKKLSVNKMPVMVSSDMMCKWIKEYFALDDKAQIEAEEAEKAKKEAEAAEKKAKKAAAEAKKAEKLQKDVKKAEILLEKEFAFKYVLTEKDQELFKKLQKEGLAAKNEEGKWYIKDKSDAENESEEDEDEEFNESEDSDDDIEFAD